MEALTGVTASGWLEEDPDFWSCVHEEDLQDLRGHLEGCRGTEKMQETRFRFRRPDTGCVRWIAERRRQVGHRGSGAVFEGHWLDVTDSVMVQQRAPTAAWHGSLAFLAPGVAHDLNNHFASILVLSDNFVRKSGPGHPFHEGARTIRDSVQEAARLVQRLVSVHLARTGERRYHDLNEIVRDTVEFLRHAISRRVSFVVDLAPGALPVHLDAAELRRAIIALVRNAVEAVPAPANGSITVRTSPEAAIPVSCRPPAGGLPGPRVCLSITDAGPGVAPEDRARLFTPWFSTKPVADSVGLGLAAAARSVEMQGGTLGFDPQDTAGTTFRIWLPQSDLSEADRVRVREAASSVLLVGRGDEALEEAAAAMREAGFHVTAASTHALEILLTRTAPFDVLCLLGDLETAAALRLMQALRSRRWPTRVAVEGTGAAPVDGGLQSPRVDLSLPAPVGRPENLARLKALLDPGSRARSPH
jgi:nitrogen-specific signal transduction histidine kinase